MTSSNGQQFPSSGVSAAIVIVFGPAAEARQGSTNATQAAIAMPNPSALVVRATRPTYATGSRVVNNGRSNFEHHRDRSVVDQRHSHAGAEGALLRARGFAEAVVQRLSLVARGGLDVARAGAL